jgi:hypothetical protein
MGSNVNWEKEAAEPTDNLENSVYVNDSYINSVFR